MTFDVRPDRRLIRPTYRSNRFVLVEVTAPAARTGRARPPVNLAFVLDRSGSMGGAKIDLAKQAVEEAIARLHERPVRDRRLRRQDRRGRAGHARHPEARRTALERLREIDARGSTNLGEGWLRGAEQVALALSAKGVNRCLLLTDGLANVGITDRDALARHAGELRARGVSTTTFGVGEDFDEALLQAMADAGGGHFYFIATPASIRDHITSEVGETLEVVARGVTLEIGAAEGVRVESLSPYPVRDGAAGQRSSSATCLGGAGRGRPSPQLPVRRGRPDDRRRVLPVGPRRGHARRGKLCWAYADDAANDHQERDRVVDRAVARMFAARARQEAVGRNRSGDFDGARHAVEATARRIRGYAGRDAELRAILAELEGAVARARGPDDGDGAQADVRPELLPHALAHGGREGQKGPGQQGG